MAAIVVEIVNKKGLHARAAAKFVKAVGNAAVTVVKLGANGEGDSPEVAGGSILGLMMLGADPGSKLRISAESQATLDTLEELVEGKFGEAE